ncbi:hypothetical protein ASE70_08180 [Sphingomonas sp. Leaf22]|uniref:DUF4893 domain-containing protein n=1 Tax=Sphingomonas sp. Leaf22 TaxID=1735687 RepID=UPI0006FE9C33|nr:DUF4893 domain-containing protein [Sphingomonas sp. Leaf22]KQM76738.1 hypothetical protein ASE70_08180 [Sphingomonas sp. Leaf22]
MKQSACIAGLMLGLSTGGCGGGAGAASAGTAPSERPAAGDDWRRVATPADRDRLRRWREAWMAALPRARAADPAAIAEQGALFQPDLALTGTAPSGRYRCRVFKLGAAGSAMRDFTAYPPFDCSIADEGRVRSFYKETGSQRPVGLLFADGDRTIFLGTLLLGDERAALQYGQDRDRDMAGVLERIGERRWRLVLPYPRFESLLDVIELVPAD